MLPKSAFCTKLGVVAHKIDDRIKNRARKGYKERDKL